MGTVSLIGCGPVPVGDGCPPQPISVVVDASRSGGAAGAPRVASSHSDTTGRYSLALPPGQYDLQAETSPTVNCPQTMVTVNPGQTTTGDISCLPPHAYP